MTHEMNLKPAKQILQTAFRWVAFAVVVLLPILLYIWLIMGSLAGQFEEKNTRAVVFLSAATIGTFLFKWRRPNSDWVQVFGGILVLYSAIYKAATFLPEISTLPWSLGWSEGSRFYYASLFFSERIYGVTVPPSVLHPSRYLMQSLAFLMPQAPLWFHRFWQVLLWLGMSLWAGIVLSKRFGTGWGFALFTLVFLFQGPVYYHLLVMVVFGVWGFDSQHLGRSMIIVLAASLWAGISRLNWFPVPGMIAAGLYFLETPVKNQSIWRYLLPAAAWTAAGTITAFLSQNAYIYLSGNPAEQFGTSMTSDLLWYRLWPNATYSLGILRSIWRVSFPLLLIILTRWLPNWKRFHWIRLLSLVGILAILFAGGVVVSVKIGGGSNLHNLDAYLVLLLILAAAFYYNKVMPEEPVPLRAQGLIWPLVFFALFIPIRDLSQVGGALPRYDFKAAESELAVLTEHVQDIALNNGEVLFINERHLLTMHLIEGVQLVPEYEVVFLMEMAMGNNSAYLGKFYRELKLHRFDAIVTGNPNPNFQDPSIAFAEENNIWVERVTLPLLCFYEVETELSDAGVSILVPRTESCSEASKY